MLAYTTVSSWGADSCSSRRQGCRAAEGGKAGVEGGRQERKGRRQGCASMHMQARTVRELSGQSSAHAERPATHLAASNHVCNIVLVHWRQRGHGGKGARLYEGVWVRLQLWIQGHQLPGSVHVVGALLLLPLQQRGGGEAGGELGSAACGAHRAPAPPPPRHHSQQSLPLPP